MRFKGDGREGEFGERFCDTDNSFELTDCDWDAGARVGADFCGMNLSTDGDEVGGELFAGFG